MKEKMALLDRLQLMTPGPDISVYDDTFVRYSLQKRLARTQCLSDDAYLEYMEQHGEEEQAFFNSLRVNYSEFFRNPLTFAVLERILFPSVLSNKKHPPGKEIRVWSAACAGGQETYSIAMILNEMADISGKINYRIFATDLNAKNIIQARKGQFSTDDLACLNLKRLKQWFTRQGNKYTIKPELKENIDFSVFDLLNERFSCPPASIFGDFDLVFCANLLFYYKQEYQTKILDKAGNSLAKGGFLVTGEVERDILLRNGYLEVYPHSAIFQRKM